MCRGYSEDFKNFIVNEHPIVIVAPFGIFSGCGSSEPTMLNGYGAIEVGLVLPYQYSTLTHSQMVLSPFVECQDHLGIISEHENIDV
ncbi:hypothetical protein Syun_004066 [Stephania yunnanensis]|uniref:Uncharacterized protein n=1 Tax=Stephania yunnanensis TaxID=152371 RepID=A0AAP0Q270_9MAGN